jgi:hypothetical protein
VARRRASCLVLSLGVVTTVPAAAAKPTKQQCVAANESAQDLQDAGKLQQARAQLTTCMNAACPRAVQEDCADRFRQTTAAIPTVVFVLKDSDGADVGAASVAEMDGAPLATALDGTPIPVDPGEHTFRFTIAGRPPITRRLSLRAGERLRRDVVFRGDSSATPPRTAPPSTPQPAPAASPDTASQAEPAPPALESGLPPPPIVPAAAAAPADEASGSRLPVTRVIAYSALGAGAAGFALTAIFGILAVGDKSSLANMCTHDDQCPPSAEPDRDALHVNGVAANISLAVGILGVVGGGLMFFWPPAQGNAAGVTATTSAPSMAPWLGAGMGGLGGTFR